MSSMWFYIKEFLEKMSSHTKRIDFTKLVEFDDKEDVYYVNSVTTGGKYKINKLKDNGHWFCTCKGYLYSARSLEKCEQTQRIRVIDQIWKYYDIYYTDAIILYNPSTKNLYQSNCSKHWGYDAIQCHIRFIYKKIIE